MTKNVEPSNAGQGREKAPIFDDIIIRIMHVMRKLGERKYLFFSSFFVLMISGDVNHTAL